MSFVPPPQKTKREEARFPPVFPLPANNGYLQNDIPICLCRVTFRGSHYVGNTLISRGFSRAP